MGELNEKIKSTDKEVLKKVITSVDGHSLYDPLQFLEQGLDPEVVQTFTTIHKSGSSPKETIYDSNGQEVPELTGVYGLELLQFIAGVFNVSSDKLGRGSQARDLQEQLLDLWK